MKTIHNLNDYKELVEQSPAVLSYFSTENCNVCKVLKPKVLALISSTFPEMETLWIDIERSPLIAGQNRIFTAPTLLVYFEGREYIRKSRNVSLAELENKIGHVYEIMFRR